MSSSKQEDYRHAAFAVAPAHSNFSRPPPSSSDVYSPAAHYQQQNATQHLSTHVADNREWCAPSYRPTRAHSTESRRYYPYALPPSRTQSSSPPYSAGTANHAQAAHHHLQSSPYSDFAPYGSLTSMPELTKSSTTVIRPDTVASSGPLPFDKEQILAQSSSRSSFVTPPNSAAPCNVAASSDAPTPTSHTSMLSLSRNSCAALDAPAHGGHPSQYQSPPPHFPLQHDSNSDNDSGHGDSPYTNVLRGSQAPVQENPESPDDSAAGDGDLDQSENGSAEFRTGSGKKLLSSDEFARVPGRLSLLGAASKYVVTVGEIKRRLSPPECLNASLLGGVLRKAKAKNGGSDLRRALDDIGVALPPGRRKATSTSMLTALVEEESKALAHQFNEVCATMFPVAEMANTVAQQHEYHARNAVFRDHRQRDIQGALNLTNELRSVMERYIAVEEEHQNKDNDRLPMTGIRQFSLITHSFGVPTISGVLALFQNYLTALLKCTGGVPIRDDHALHCGQMR